MTIDNLITDLVNRRNVQDAELFSYCFWFILPEDDTAEDDVKKFKENARAAFKEYHVMRAKGYTIVNGHPARIN